MKIDNTKEIVKIPFCKVRINPFNPRHIPLLEEYSAAMWLIIDDIKGMLKLITSFVECGFLPFPVAVIKESGTDYYLALDGNRRLTALKLLSGLINLPEDRKYFQLKEYVEKNKLESLDFQLDCLIYDTEEEAASYLVSIHQNGGSIPGQKTWTPLQQNRYADIHSKKVDDWYLFVKKYLAAEDLETLKQPTTLTRIINNQKFKEILLFDCNYDCKLDEATREAVIKKIVYDLNSGVINSRTINSSKEAGNYIDEIASILGIKQVNSQNDSKQLPISNIPTNLPASSKQGNNKPGTQNFNNPVRNSTTPFRKTIIPNHVNLSCSNTKINYLNNDLKKLDINICKTTCAIALRVLIELLTKFYMLKNFMKTASELEKPSTLHSDITSVLNDMRNKKLIADALHHQCSAYVNKQERTLFLNGCIHHLDVNPDTENLIEMFDTLEKYLIICSAQ